MKEQSFNTLPTPSAFWDSLSCSWRMSQASLLSEEPALLDRLPKSGMTVNGKLYERAMLELATEGQDGSVLLVTPTASEKDQGRPERYVERGLLNNRSTRFDLTDQIAYLKTPQSTHQMQGDPERFKERAVEKVYFKKEGEEETETRYDLSDQVAYLELLPTPTAQAAKHGATPDIHRNSKMGANLWDLPHVLPDQEELLPTPTAWEQRESQEQWEERIQKDAQLKNSTGRRIGMPLPIAVKLLPTPVSRDHKDTGNMDYQRQADRSILTGVIMVQLSEDGKKSQED